MVLARGAAGRGSEHGLLPADGDRGTLRQRAASASYGVASEIGGRFSEGPCAPHAARAPLIDYTDLNEKENRKTLPRLLRSPTICPTMTTSPRQSRSLWT